MCICFLFKSLCIIINDYIYSITVMSEVTPTPNDFALNTQTFDIEGQMIVLICPVANPCNVLFII